MALSVALNPPVTEAQIVSFSPLRRRLVVGAVMTGMFLSAMEQTVVGTAMPTVIARLGGLQYYSWVFAAYLLALTVTGPIWGKLSDSHGRRTIFDLGILVFLIGSALAGQSRSMGQLIVFRAIQGLGAGALMPVCLTVLGDLYRLEDRARMAGYTSSVWGVASLAGPLIGGFLTDHLSWRWVFYVNLPFGLLAILAMTAWQEPASARTRHPVDVAGALTLSAGVLLLMLELTAVARGGSVSPAAMLVALGLLCCFVWLESRAPEPIIALDLFRNRIFWAASVTGTLTGAVLQAAATFMPLFVQAVVGTSATGAGGVLTPMMLAWVLSNVPVGRAMIVHGYRALSLVGAVLLAVGFWLMTTLDSGATWTKAALSMVLTGAGMSCCFMPMTVAVQSAVSRGRRGMATSSLQFFRSIGGALGVAFLGAMLSASFEARLGALSGQGPGPLGTAELRELASQPERIVDPGERARLPVQVVPKLVGALAASLHDLFVAATVVTLILLAASWMVPGGKPHLHQFAEEPATDSGRTGPLKP